MEDWPGPEKFFIYNVYCWLSHAPHAIMSHHVPLRMYIHPLTLCIRGNPDLEREYQLMFIAERCWWDRVGAVLRLLCSLKLCSDLWGRAQRLRNTPLLQLATWRRHVAGLAVCFLPLQMFACLSLLLLSVKPATRNRLTALLNINSVIALSTMLFTNLAGQQWTCNHMPQVFQYAVYNLLVFPFFHTQSFARHLYNVSAALIVSALVVGKPGGVCGFLHAHAQDPVCGRLVLLTTRGCRVLQSVVAFVAQGQLKGLEVDPCRALLLFALLLCAAASTLVLYHIELYSRVTFLVSRQAAPSSLLDQRRDQLARDVKLVAPVSFYVFWVLLLLTGRRSGSSATS